MYVPQYIFPYIFTSPLFFRPLILFKFYRPYKTTTIEADQRFPRPPNLFLGGNQSLFLRLLLKDTSDHQTVKYFLEATDLKYYFDYPWGALAKSFDLVVRFAKLG